MVSTPVTVRDRLKLRVYPVATSAAMLFTLAQTLGAGKKW